MANEAVRIKVDKNVYQETLSKLETQLGNLMGYRDDLQRQIDRLNSGNTFAGSDVRIAIQKAEEALEKVKDTISRVSGYKVSIQQALSGTEQAASQLAGDMSAIDIPNMFS